MYNIYQLIFLLTSCSTIRERCTSLVTGAGTPYYRSCAKTHLMDQRGPSVLLLIHVSLEFCRRSHVSYVR